MKTNIGDIFIHSINERIMCVHDFQDSGDANPICEILHDSTGEYLRNRPNFSFSKKFTGYGYRAGDGFVKEILFNINDNIPNQDQILQMLQSKDKSIINYAIDIIRNEKNKKINNSEQALQET